MYIPRRDREDNLYHRLQQEALQMVQQLCGKVWTDYNPHDPGITILDHLHYALLELSYGLDFPFPDYLPHRKEREHSDFHRAALFSGEELFSPSVVTTTDYEKLFLSAFPQIQKCRVRCGDVPAYQILIEPSPDTDLKVLHKEVTALYHRYRQLGETLAEVRFVPSLSSTSSPEQEPLLQTETPPAGEDAHHPCHPDLRFHSIQKDFPDCYGVNEQGMLQGIDTSHRAGILQLKSYLSLYDYLLQSVYSQITHLPDLLAIDTRLHPSAFTPIPVPDSGLLIDPQRMRETVPVEASFFHQQRSIYLDLLDRMYGEDTRHLASLLTDTPFSPEEENRRRACLLRQLPGINRHRSRAWNLSDPSSEKEATIKQLLLLLQEAESLPAFPLSGLLSKYGLRFCTDATFFSRFAYLFPSAWRFAPTDLQVGEYEVREVPESTVKYQEALLRRYCRNVYLFCHEVVFDSFLLHGEEQARYRMASRGQEKDFLLLFRYTDGDDWLPLGFFHNRQQLTATVSCLREFVCRLRRQSSTFYLIEHILLRPGVAQSDPSFSAHRISFVFPAWNTPLRQRERVEQLIRERLPAHLEPLFHWVDRERMLSLEKTYLPWRQALAGSDDEVQRHLCGQLYTWINSETTEV